MGFFYRKKPLNGHWLDVALDNQGSVAPLKEVFYFVCVGFSPAASALSRHILQEFDSFAIPATKCLNDEGLKDDSS